MSSTDSAVHVSDTVFVNNEASWGGAASVNDGTFTNCIFYNNRGLMDSGALYGTGVVENSVFVNNNSGGVAGLGGHFAVRDSVFFMDGMIACDGSSVSRSVFTGGNNALATGDTAFSDVVFAGVGFGCVGSDTASESLTCGWYLDGQASLTNLTVAGSAYSGLNAQYGCEADVHGALIWDSEGAEIAGAATVTYSLVQGGYAGEGNISSNPLFVGYPASSGTWTDAYFDEGLFQTELTDDTASWEAGELAGSFVNVSASGPTAVIADNTETTLWAWGNATSYAAVGDEYEILDLHLQSGSPAIDAGYGLGASEFDVEGNARYDDPGATNAYDCGADTDCVEYVDMGAYERQP